MENESIFKDHPSSISFHEVRVFPSSQRHYQLFRSGNSTAFVYSESYLAEFFKNIDLKSVLK